METSPEKPRPVCVARRPKNSTGGWCELYEAGVGNLAARREELRGAAKTCLSGDETVETPSGRIECFRLFVAPLPGRSVSEPQMAVW